MNTLDIILLSVLGIGFIYGYIKGIIKQLSFGAGIILGLLQAVLFYPVVAEWIKGYTGWEEWATTAAAFVAIFLAVMIALKVAGVLLAAILKFIHLQFIDSVLGALFSTIVAMFLFMGGMKLANDIIPDNKYTNKTSQNSSLLYKYVQGITSLIIDEAEKKI